MALQKTRFETTPRTRFTFRIGVVGHRFLDETQELEDAVKKVLTELRRSAHHVARQHTDLFDRDAPAQLRIVSSLAEGGDQLVARAALTLAADFEICCPLPFAAADQSAEATQSLDRFLAEHSERISVFELDGSPAHKDHAYAAAAEVLLQQSDVLVAIWDGKKGAGPGGTADTVEKALARGIRVVWIHARTPSLIRVLTGRLLQPTGGWSGDNELEPSAMTDLGGLTEIVMVALGLPDEDSAQHPAESERIAATIRFYREKMPRFRVAWMWKLFRSVWGPGGLVFLSPWVPQFDDKPDPDWLPEEPEPLGWVNRQLAVHYYWADTLAELNADAYRSSFVVSYGLSAIAGILALLPLAMKWDVAHEPVRIYLCHFLEFAVVVTIVWILVWGRNRDWHRRWLDYRIVAELVRQLKVQIPLGGTPAKVSPSQSLGERGPAQTWMYWHVRALERTIGLPPARVPKSYARTCVLELRRILRAQCEFHHNSVHRAEKIEHRIHRAGTLLFIITAFLVALEFSTFVYEKFDVARPASRAEPTMHVASESNRDGLSVMFAACLPALGAALAAIANQGEFGRIARRSKAMTHGLEALLARVEQSLDSEIVTAEEANGLVTLASQLMVDEVFGWRVLLIDRPLVLPS